MLIFYMDKSIILKANRHLKKNDTVMAELIKNYQPFSFDDTKTITKPNHFHILVRTIISQQLSIKAAETIQNRLLKAQGGRVFNVKKLAILSDKQVRECGISKNKIRYIRTIILAVVAKELNFKKLEKLDDAAISECLVKYPGIGPWSAEIILMAAFQRLDVLPIGDLIIRKSMQYHYDLTNNSSYDEYYEIAKAWQPYRTIASRYLWASAPR